MTPVPDDRMLRVGVQRMRVDAWTAEVVSGLQASGIEPVLLKGPVTLDWLYPGDRSLRAYGDVDLLVAPHHFEAAVLALLPMGFEQSGELLPPWDEGHARSFIRPSDGAAVDLHRMVHGTQGVPASKVWAVFSRGVERKRVGGVDVATPGEAVRTLHLALHFSPKDEEGSWAAEHLKRGLDVLPPAVWQEAGQLARELDIADEMGHRLSRVPLGAAMAERLGLPTGETALYLSMRLAGGGPTAPGIHSLLAFSGQRGFRRKAAYLGAKLARPAQILRRENPRAQQGGAGLALARMAWIATCVARAPGALRYWRRLRQGDG